MLVKNLIQGINVLFKLCRYENTRLKESLGASETQGTSQPNCEPLIGLAKACSAATAILDGHSMVRKKYYPLHIEQEMSFKGCLALLDDALRINED